ncbi:MAG: flagellar hook-length control protein FliK [Phycisphaerae bacterium]
MAQRLLIERCMDTTSINNLFALLDARMVMPQPKADFVGVAKQGEQCIDAVQDKIVSAENGSVTEKVEFKDALTERENQVTDDKQEEIKPADESDNETTDDAVNNVFAMLGDVTANIEMPGQNADAIQISPEQKAAAVLSYLKGTELAADEAQNEQGNTENAVIDELLGGTKEAVNPKANEQVLEANSNNNQQQVEEQVVQQNTEQKTTGQQSANQNQPTISKELGGQEQKVTVQTVNEQPVTQENQNTQTQQVKVEATQAVNAQPNVEIKPANTNETPEKIESQQTAANQEFAVETEGSAEKNSTKNDTGSFLKQDGAEQQVVINTDMTEKAPDVAKAEQPNQSQFGKEVYEKAGEQINESIANSVKAGEDEVTVRLNPPELGSVVIRLNRQDGQVTGSLEFSRAETKSEIQQLMPQLVRNLADSGIAVKRLDVIQTQIDNTGQQQQFREHVAQDGGAYQQFSQNQSQSGPAGGYDWLSGESIYAGSELTSDSYISDAAVNILV